MKKSIPFALLVLGGCSHAVAPATGASPSPIACKQTERAYLLAEQTDCFKIAAALVTHKPPISAAVLAKDNAFCNNILVAANYNEIPADACVPPGKEYVPQAASLRRAR